MESVPTIDRFLERASNGHEHRSVEVENAPATLVMFREWDYSKPFFTEGMLTLHGDDLPFSADEFIGVDDESELDYFYPYER